MSLGKLKRRLFRKRLAARRVEDLRRYLMFGPSIQSPPNARDFARAFVVLRQRAWDWTPGLLPRSLKRLEEFR